MDAQLFDQPPPALHAYWFYTSPLPLDDPLCPLPAPTAPTAATKYPPRPFSRFDCNALEDAYQEQLLKRHLEADGDSRSRPSSSGGSIFRGRSSSGNRRRDSSESIKTIREVAREGKPIIRKNDTTSSAGDEVLELRDEMDVVAGVETPLASSVASSVASSGDHNNYLRRSSSPLRSFFTPSASPATTSSSTTRNPFIRSLSLSRANTMPNHPPASRSSSSQRNNAAKQTPPPSPTVQTEIPVGIQRLHKVLLPSFVMTPIYWSPLHDIASVMRGTWFYKDTMLPVETETANRLEAGWEEVRAWTEEWEVELSSAVEVGREGEEKVRWQLWEKPPIPSSLPNSRPGTAQGGGMTSENENFSSLPIPPNPTKNTAAGQEPPSRTKPNEWDWVLFANEKDAYICRDTMLSFGNKRPLANIRKGRVVGTHVVRGFCEKEWERLHPTPKGSASSAAAGKRRSASFASSPANSPGTARDKEKRNFTTGHLRTPMPGFQAGGNVAGLQGDGMGSLGRDENEDRGKVTDLFLVIHGIGQKLSERVESFHFTHAINSFRRMMNVELRDEAVKPYLRKEGVGMMVLPINWRSTLSFEEGLPPPGTNGTTNDPNRNNFSLADITPPTIPAVRNLIGDVMLDIPYYLSHHKQKMVRAVVKEANRVYRLWCKNNPGFERHGRVHIIAHSLGSAIAMDILSHQPTRLDELRVPSAADKCGRPSARKGKKEDVGSERFEFDTKSVFFVGSPAAFFLFLNRRTLLPRKGRNKPGADGEDIGEGIAGEAGMYGCMAVDNIYNVLHYSDPIAYRLNPTVDIDYAASLKTASVPSTATTFLGSISSTFRSVLPATATSASNAYSASAPTTAFPSISRLPSTIELETHDFSREELAEKRLFLLNENGNLDWYLQQGAGALENQYLNMLGAHSSYWESRDFVRFCVVEAGRRPGRQGTLESMRGVKKRGFMGR